MGLLADIFVATPAAAKRYEVSLLMGPRAHGKQFPNFKCRGLTVLDFGYLWAVLNDDRWKASKYALEECEREGSLLQQLFPEKKVQAAFAEMYKRASASGKDIDWSSNESDSALLRFPEEFVGLLADLAGSDEAPAAAKWRAQLQKRSQLKLTLIQTRNIVIAMARLAERVASGQTRVGLYLWTSL